MLGHLDGALHVIVQRLALYKPGPADHRISDATFSHHAVYVFDVVLQLFSSIFCEDEPVQIRRDLIRFEKGEEGISTPSRVYNIRI